MRLDNQLSKYYYTAAQARKRLGLDEEAFQYWVRKERIHKTILPGRVKGVYSRKETDELANQIAATLIAEQPERIEFRKATINDIEEEAKLAHLVFGEKAEAIKERTTFLEKNADIDYHLYDQDKLGAYINIIPLRHEAIESFMQGKVKAWEINSDSIEQFMPEKALECLIIDMVTTPTVPPNRRAMYGARLLSGLIRVLAEMGKKGIIITKIYAASETPTGIRILKNAGFQVTQEARKGRFSFELDITNTDEKALKEYKENLEEWERSQKASQNNMASKTRIRKPKTPSA